MTTEEFIVLVNRMREAQREYFRTRDREVLIQSKDLEHMVDGWLIDYFHRPKDETTDTEA